MLEIKKHLFHLILGSVLFSSSYYSLSGQKHSDPHYYNAQYYEAVTENLKPINVDATCETFYSIESINYRLIKGLQRIEGKYPEPLKIKGEYLPQSVKCHIQQYIEGFIDAPGKIADRFYNLSKSNLENEVTFFLIYEPIVCDDTPQFDFWKFVIGVYHKPNGKPFLIGKDIVDKNGNTILMPFDNYRISKVQKQNDIYRLQIVQFDSAREERGKIFSVDYNTDHCIIEKLTYAGKFSEI